MGYPKDIEEFSVEELADDMARRRSFNVSGLCSYCHNWLKGAPEFKGVECRYHEENVSGQSFARRYKHG